jgi:serine/threonine protein kinase
MGVDDDPPRPGRRPAPASRDEAIPEDPAARLRLADELLARGEAAAARALLQPFEDGDHPLRRDALLRLATMDEHEGRPADARRRWERLLADDIDDDRAWSHLSRLRPWAGLPGELPLGGSGISPPTLDSAAGVNVGRFEIVRELGRGSSATVYLARDRALELELALKVLHPVAGVADRDRAFFHEARAVAGLRHPGVVAIYDVDEPARTLVMEYIAGGTIRDRLRARQGAEATPQGLEPADVMGLAGQLLDTLAFVHDHGVVHGDLTPRNVLLRASGEPVLVDFGIARTREGAGPGDEGPAGTPLYLSPEQLRGAPASERTDLFAAGALLWEALTGRPMRAHADLVAGTIASRPLPSELLHSLPAELRPLARLITALTQGAPEHRPASAAEALAMLRSPAG